MSPFRPNQTRQATPGRCLCVERTRSARRACAFRSLEHFLPTTNHIKPISFIHSCAAVMLLGLAPQVRGEVPEAIHHNGQV